MSDDMRSVIVPKSDQQNADDFISGPRTIKITGVAIQGGQEQPVAISFEGDSGKPYKPCKSMSRVLVASWGPDAKAYIGRSLTLYRDPTIKWGGLEVGGIRISHMSDIDTAMTMALTATKGSRKPFTVKPLARSTSAKTAPKPEPHADQPPMQPNPETVNYLTDQFAGSENLGQLAVQWTAAQKCRHELNAEDWATILAAKDARKVALTEAEE